MTRDGRSRRTRSFTPGVDALEGRELQAIISVKFDVNIHPAVLPPTNGEFVPVHIYGELASSKPAPFAAFYRVTDEYRTDEPHGTITLGPSTPSYNFFLAPFDFTINLQAERGTGTMDGRHYDIFIGATDVDNTDGHTYAVYVPKNYPKNGVVAKPITVKAVAKH